MDISDVIVGVRFPETISMRVFSAQTPVCLPVRNERLLCRSGSLYNVNRLGRGGRLWKKPQDTIVGEENFEGTECCCC